MVIEKWHLTVLGILTCMAMASASAADVAARVILANWERELKEYTGEENNVMVQRDLSKPMVEKLNELNLLEFTDPLLKRQVEVLLRNDGYPRIDKTLKEDVRLLQTMAHQKWVCDRNQVQVDKCNIAFVPEIKAIFTNTQDPVELLYYWREWRERLPSEVKTAFHGYTGYYRNAYNPRYGNNSALWYSDYDDANTFEMLENVWMEIMPLYKELHAHLRHLLKKRYGENIIPTSGLIPHHLLQKAAYQAWKKYSILSNPYESKRLPNLQTGIEKLYPSPRKFIHSAVDFFQSLGFDNYPTDFIDKHFKVLDKGNSADCKPTFNDVKNEVHYCTQVNYRKLMQMHGYVARFEYNMVKGNLSVGLNLEAAPGFSDAIGEATILSVSNPKHLQANLHLLENYNYDEERNLNRLYRMAVHTLLTLPAYLVHERLWIEIMDGKMTRSQYNCRYWELMQQYMGVNVAVVTLPGTFDMPDKFYEGIIYETSSTRKLFGEFMGYRIYRDLCQHIGEFEPGNPAKPLDHCDWTNSKEVGKILREIMSLGSMKPWKEIMKRTPFAASNTLDGSAFQQYYEPVWKWLKTENAESNITVGWQTEKCVYKPGMD